MPLPFQTGERSQTHIHDRLGLGVRKSKPLHQLRLGSRYIGGSADNTDHLVDVIQGLQESLQDMGAFLGLG